MNSLKTSGLLSQFAKKSKAIAYRKTNNCVIYTRVSSKEQADNNTSLESQKRYCTEYCQRKGYNIKEYFGGTYESAQKDERKEFKRMLDYVKRNENIDSIIVYSYDRFSRSGANAVYLTEELSKRGIVITAVSQEIDTSSPAGKFQKNIFLLFSQFDNDLRRDKTVKGMIENLRNGYWVAIAPFGYTNLNKKDKAKNHHYVINKDGELLKIAFKLKAEGKLTNKQIVEKVQKLGSTMTYKNFNFILSNPFYCGYITHSLIPDEVYKGQHPPLISEELFLKANNVKNESARLGIGKVYEINELSLKTFAKDELTLSPLTGFKQKGIYYYKARHKEAKANVNAAHLNGLFIKELKRYEIDKAYTVKLKEKLYVIIVEKLKDQLVDISFIKKQITELKNKIDKLEERYIDEEIDRDLFHKYLEKYKTEKQLLEEKINTPDWNSSNLEKIIEKGLQIAENISEMWASGDFNEKRQLQKLIFPEGILYNKIEDRVQTPRVNSLFLSIPFLTSVSEENKNGFLIEESQKSHLVTPSGFKPETF